MNIEIQASLREAAALGFGLDLDAMGLLGAMSETDRALLEASIEGCGEPVDGSRPLLLPALPPWGKPWRDVVVTLYVRGGPVSCEAAKSIEAALNLP